MTLVNIYAPNLEAPKYVKHILMYIKEEINRHIVKVGNFNIPLTSMDRSSRQKIGKQTVALNNTVDQMDLIDIFRAFHPKATNYTFFSSAHGMFSRIDHMLGHKTSLSKFKNSEITSSIFSDHNETRNQSQEEH